MDSMDTPPLVYPFNMHGHLDCFQPGGVTKREVDVRKSPGAAWLCQCVHLFKKLTDILFVVFNFESPPAVSESSSCPLSLTG